MAWSWFRQSGVVSSHPPAGNASRSALDTDLIEWLDQCDVILHDVLVPPWAFVEAVQRLHAPIFRLLELPATFQRKTYLYHVDENTYLDHDPGEYRYLEQQKVYKLKGDTARSNSQS